MQRINNIELKFICVEILSEIDRVCAKYGLHYFANFGTLIGAVRHKDLFLGMMMLMFVCQERIMSNFWS